MDILNLLLSSVDSLCKQIGSRQNVQPDLDPNYLTLMVFLIFFV